MTDRAVVILAAGASLRLGQPKALVSFAGQKLLARAVEAASGAGAAAWFTESDAQSLLSASLPSAFGARRLSVSNADEGMSASLRVAATTAISDHRIQFLCVLPVDQYAVDARWLSALFDLALQYPNRMVASTIAGRRGAPAVFSRGRFADLLTLSGDRGARELLRTAPDDAVIDWPAPWPPGDVDTIADLAVMASWQPPS
ncbi:hypothetical protein C7S18_03525 [Ahniella affigens]|uniref:MobA-like NTP transferase domain-containing protein n=1 Tax=Ahniella affigens TaxID=2021234 RepID=A0A2P1PNC2_9GAMM|nr:NTP transferase domain-containing protein [Ahniella affigens]AVP96315.1 hypothetical protein C7S18_03525 [Ahniella affigens]